MRIIDRFDKYMEVSGINDNQVTVNCTLSVGLLGKARKGENDLGKKAIEKILSFYQNLNRVWLLTGEGEMLKSAKKPILTSNNSSSDPMSILQFLMEEKKAASSQIEELIRQNGILAETIRSQNEIIKKTMGNQELDAHLEDSATCANVSGSDLED